jgi:putative flippase GtrA
VPTRNEAGNVAELVRRLEGVLPDTPTEIVFVDDSDDQTPAVVQAVQTASSRDIVLLHRPVEKRLGGLGGAVVDGFRVARGEWLCVMDGDLQHPPEVVEHLWREAHRSAADLVVASRYTEGGDGEALGWVRSAISRGFTAVSKVAFRRQLATVSDPMSGFFLVRRQALRLDDLRPAGLKILLEILVRHPSIRTSEVSFEFCKRYAGESKASLREGFTYLTHLASMRFGGGPQRLLRFVLVGASGLVVNTALLALLTDGIGLYYLVSALVATQGSTLWNFALTERWVFHDRTEDGVVSRAALFFLVNNAALGVRGPMLFVLVSGIGLYYLAANVLAFGLLAAARYALADRLIWGRTSVNREPLTYEIHNILKVESDTALPELAKFQVAPGGRPADIVVSVRQRAPRRVAEGVRHLAYREGLGRLGFAVDIVRDDRIHVYASRLLRWSPHVLYTNVVEPILRWRFVEEGYALVHGACLAAGDRALLITARTDTGKTTTILRTLDHYPFSFLSDDLTLVAADGRVLRYPKPLTISRHTLAAVKTPLLSRRQRFMLRYQSRVHSRSGRKAAFFMTRMALPLATINAVVQMLVPPPKYHVQQLIPGVNMGGESTLQGLVIIERGGRGQQVLAADAALTTLLENCEDAYGFPPYRQIEGFLHSGEGRDLRPAEAAIIRQALAATPAWAMQSDTMDWWERLPGVFSSVLRVEQRAHTVEAAGATSFEVTATPEAAVATDLA